MKSPVTSRAPITWAAALLLTLAACGGGGGGDSGAGGAGNGNGGTTPIVNGPGTETPVALAQLSGIAATGAAFAYARILVTDQTGIPVCEKETDANGAYFCELPAGTKAPLVIRASRDEQVFYSTTASAASGVVNVTPLTTIIVSQLSPDGNPANLAGVIKTQPDTVTATTIRTQVDELIAALQPLLKALDQSTVDIMNGVFVADGTGQDKLLDAISVSVLPNGTSANIEITVKAKPTSENAAPISLVINTAADTPLQSLPPVIPPTSLDATPPPAAVAALMERLTACYALPLTQRVNSATSDTVSATGNASNVVATACRTLFVGDDPSTFYSNGYHVGRDINNAGSFAGLFRSGATGVVFERGNYEYARTNGDVVLSYRTVDRNGNVDTDTIIARNAGGTLKLTGNEYKYRAAVRPYSEDRDTINSPTFSAFTTGYDVAIDKFQSSGAYTGKVVVTTPFGRTLTFYPTPGLSFLALSRSGQPGDVLATSVVRLAGAYQNPSTQGSLAERETGIYFLSPEYTEAQISAVANRSVWTMDFYDAAGALDTTQTYRTLSRAQTLGEIRQLAFAQPTAAQRQELIAVSNTNGRYIFGAPSAGDPNIIDFSSEGDGDAWVVPVGALPPTTITAFGNGPSPSVGVAGVAFNDAVGVSATQRKGIIYCASQGGADTHCAPNLVNPTQYADGSSIFMLDLLAKSSRQVLLSKKIALYKRQ